MGTELVDASGPEPSDGLSNVRLHRAVNQAGLVLVASERDVGAVIAGRSDRSFSTFPAVQRSTEAWINERTGAMIAEGLRLSLTEPL